MNILQVLENETFKFEEQICDYEEDPNNGSIEDEEVRDCVFAAIGKAKLLMAQKLAQFRGLCDKNIVSINHFIFIFEKYLKLYFLEYFPGRRSVCSHVSGFGWFLGHGFYPS